MINKEYILNTFFIILLLKIVIKYHLKGDYLDLRNIIN